VVPLLVLSLLVLQARDAFRASRSSSSDGDEHAERRQPFSPVTSFTARILSMNALRRLTPETAQILVGRNKSFRYSFGRRTTVATADRAVLGVGEGLQENSPIRAAQLFEELSQWQSPEPEATRNFFSSRPCVNATTADGAMRSYYDDNKLFTLENFCIGVDGGLAGFRSNLSRYASGTEIMWAKIEPGMPSSLDIDEIRGMLEHVQPLSHAPACLLDAPVLIFPVTAAYNNVGHDLYRIVSLLRIRRLVWRSVDQDVALLRFYAPSGLRRLYPGHAMDASAFFLRFLGPLQFGAVSVNASRNGFARQVDQLRTATRSALDSARICLRRGVVWHNAAEGGGHAEVQYSLYGPRGPGDQAATAEFRLMMADFASLRLRQQPNRRAPRVLFAVRSTHRNRFVEHDMLVRHLQAAVERIGGVLDVVEHTREDDARGMLQRYADADIIYGAYGAGLIWAMFAPPGGVVGVLSTSKWGATCGRTGVNLCSDTDYSGHAYSSGHHHVELRLPDELLVSRDEDIWLDTPTGVHDELLRAMLCLLRREQGQGSVLGASAAQVAAMSIGSCALDTEYLDRVTQEHLLDASASVLQRIAQRLGKKAARARGAAPVPFGWMLDAAEPLAAALRPFRSGLRDVRTVEVVSNCRSRRHRLGWHRLLYHYARHSSASVVVAPPPDPNLGVECGDPAAEAAVAAAGIDDDGMDLEDGDPIPVFTGPPSTAPGNNPNVVMTESEPGVASVALGIALGCGADRSPSGGSACVMVVVGPHAECVASVAAALKWRGNSTVCTSVAGSWALYSS
jgi:hypothetical protein